MTASNYVYKNYVMRVRTSSHIFHFYETYAYFYIPFICAHPSRIGTFQIKSAHMVKLPQQCKMLTKHFVHYNHIH